MNMDRRLVHIVLGFVLVVSTAAAPHHCNSAKDKGKCRENIKLQLNLSDAELVDVHKTNSEKADNPDKKDNLKKEESHESHESHEDEPDTFPIETKPQTVQKNPEVIVPPLPQPIARPQQFQPAASQPNRVQPSRPQQFQPEVFQPNRVQPSRPQQLQPEVFQPNRVQPGGTAGAFPPVRGNGEELVGWTLALIPIYQVGDRNQGALQKGKEELKITEKRLAAKPGQNPDAIQFPE